MEQRVTYHWLVKKTSSIIPKHIHHTIYTRCFVGYNSFQLSKSYMRIASTFSCTGR